jgi:hypothetical protein
VGFPEDGEGVLSAEEFCVGIEGVGGCGHGGLAFCGQYAMRRGATENLSDEVKRWLGRSLELSRGVGMADSVLSGFERRGEGGYYRGRRVCLVTRLCGPER